MLVSMRPWKHCEDELKQRYTEVVKDEERSNVPTGNKVKEYDEAIVRIGKDKDAAGAGRCRNAANRRQE